MRIEPASRAGPSARPALLALLASAALSASAQTGPYYLAFGHSLNHESNIYRLSDGVSPPAGASRADTVSISSLLAGFAQTISRQHVRGDAVLRSSRFRHNEALDNEGHGLRLAWDGSTVGRLSGSASLNIDRSLVRVDAPATPGRLERNIATSRQLDAALRWAWSSGWSFETAAGHVQVDFSSPSFDAREYRQNSVSGGLRWSGDRGLSVSLGGRTLRGHYPRFANDGQGNFFADRYEGRFADLGLRWTGSVVHQFEGRLSGGSTRYERATATDFSGLTGTFAWTWRPTAKLRLTTRYVRDRGQDSSPIGYVLGPDRAVLPGRYADFSRVSTSQGSTLDWALSAKLSVQTTLSRVERDLRSTVTDTSLAVGKDRARFVNLAARWQATRGIVLGCDVGRERRSTNNTAVSSNLGNRTHNCFGQVAIP